MLFFGYELLGSRIALQFIRRYEFASQTLWYDRLVASNCAKGAS